MNIYCIRPKGFNIGNDIIFLAMKQFLPKANIITLPATSRYDGDRAGLTSKTIYEINQFGDGVIIGGGNLYENNELDVDLNALDKLEVPLFLYSLSRGRIYNRKSELVNRTDVMPDKKIKALNEKAFISTYRDIATQAYICEGLVCACPTLFLDKIKLPFPEVKNDLTLISIRNPNLMSIPTQEQDNVVICIRKLLKEFKDAKILCHDWRDIQFAESIKSEYIYTENVFEFLDLLKNCKLNISFRLHSTLPCLSYGSPVISVSYDERMSSLLETIGYKEWNINIMEVHNLIDAIKSRYINRNTLKDLKENNQSLWNDFYNINQKLFNSFTKEMS